MDSRRINTESNMLDILSHRTYCYLFAAQVIAMIGTSLATVAFGLLIFELAGDNAGMVLGTALAINVDQTLAEIKHGLDCRLCLLRQNWL